MTRKGSQVQVLHGPLVYGPLVGRSTTIQLINGGF